MSRLTCPLTVVVLVLGMLADALIASPATGATNGEYQLGAGDGVKITAYNSPDLATEAHIADDGTIPFPLVGRVALAGLNKAAAEQKLSKLLVDGGFLREAAINLTITEYRSQHVSVLGAVNKPGKYPIKSAASVLDMLAEAGGVAENGATSIRLVQRDASDNPVQRDIDLSRLVASGDATLVRSGDVIFVAERPVFYIYGEVQKPGAYSLEPSMTVRQAIATGGGLTMRGTERGLRVSRRNDAGRVEVYRAKLTDQLLAGDVLQVKESLF